MTAKEAQQFLAARLALWPLISGYMTERDKCKSEGIFDQELDRTESKLWQLKSKLWDAVQYARRLEGEIGRTEDKAASHAGESSTERKCPFHDVIQNLELTTKIGASETKAPRALDQSAASIDSSRPPVTLDEEPGPQASNYVRSSLFSSGQRLSVNGKGQADDTSADDESTDVEIIKVVKLRSSDETGARLQAHRETESHQPRRHQGDGQSSRYQLGQRESRDYRSSFSINDQGPSEDGSGSAVTTSADGDSGEAGNIKLRPSGETRDRPKAHREADSHRSRRRQGDYWRPHHDDYRHVSGLRHTPPTGPRAINQQRDVRHSAGEQQRNNDHAQSQGQRKRKRNSSPGSNRARYGSDSPNRSQTDWSRPLRSYGSHRLTSFGASHGGSRRGRRGGPSIADYGDPNRPIQRDPKWGARASAKR